MINLNSLSGNSYTSMSLEPTSGYLFCSVYWTMFLYFKNLLYNFVLWSHIWGKQPSLQVYADWFYVSKDLHQSVQLEILGVSQTFFVDISSLASIFKFLTRRFFQFLFSRACSLVLPLDVCTTTGSLELPRVLLSPLGTSSIPGPLSALKQVK